MSIAKWTNGRRGASGKHVSYITRDGACHSVSFHNLEELEGASQFESKTNAISYAYAKEDIEGEGRTHYRLLLSWDRKEDTEKAKQMVHEYIGENFNSSRAVISIHQDTDNTHAHIWIDARKLDDKKLHISKKDFERIRDNWTRQFDRTYNTKFEKEYQEKYEETRIWSQNRMKSGKRVGKQPRPQDKPQRAEVTSKEWREKDERSAGAKLDVINKERFGRNQQFAKERERVSERAKLGITQATNQLNRTESEARGLHQKVEKLVREPKELRDAGEPNR